MVGTPVDQDLTLGDLMAVINEFKLSDRPVTTETVIAALVARTNANCAAFSSSHSERIPVLPALARTNADSAARLEMNANHAVHLETVRPSYSAHTKPVPNRASLVGTNANHAVHHETVAPEPVSIRAPLAATNVKHTVHRETVAPEPVSIRAPLAATNVKHTVHHETAAPVQVRAPSMVGTNVNRTVHHETVVPLYSQCQRVPGRVSLSPAQSTNIQSNTTAIVTSRYRKRFYAVIVGRQTGVFDDWQIVKELTVRIPNNCQYGFATEDEAFDYYNLQKEQGKVQVTWLSRAEESRYGPMSVALF